MSVWNHKLRKSLMAAGVSTALAFGGTAVAQQGGQVAPQGGQAGTAPQGKMPELTEEQRQLMEQMRSVRQELQQTQAKLSELEQQAYENNPELGKKRDALQDTIAEKMSDDGYDAAEEFKEMKATMAEYQQGDKQPSQAEVKAFREKQQAFQQRQQKAFQDPEVQSMAEDLRADVKKQMKQDNPKAEELFDKMEQKAEEMQALRQQAMQMQKQGG
ncbi:MAG: hypothetical protein JXJ30_08580 [Halothiobacillaceae bacterium]|nr:hypothetical protein [Halothiobacillaceae bacterium]